MISVHAWVGSASRKLFAVFIDRHGRRGDDIVTVRQAVNRDLNQPVANRQFLVLDPVSFVTDHQRGSTSVFEFVQHC